MRYAKTISEDKREATILTEDGGVASIHHNGSHLITTRYQDRVNHFDDDEMWEILSESKQYLKDWKGKHEVNEEMIHDALAWLCPTERDWYEEDFYLFTTEFNHQQNKRRADA